MKQALLKVKEFFKNLHLKIKNSKLFTVILKEQEPKHEWNNWVCLLLQFLFSFFVEFLIEAFSRHSISSAFTFIQESTQVYFYNSVYIFLWSLIAFLFRKRRLWRVIIFALWLFLGIGNGIILSNRVTPLTGPDLKNVTEALGVVKKYFTMNEIILGIIAIVLLLLFIIVYIFRCPRYKGKMHYLLNIAAIGVCIFGFNQYTQYCLNNNILSSYFSNIAFAYQDYGFPYCFTVTITDTGISEPNNYSKQEVETIVSESKEKVGETTANLDYKPNVIFVQLESFFDPSRVNYLELSEDPIPNWHALCEDYTNGFLTVPTIGAGTVNTEFEVLTGMSMHFFGAGEYPYKGILQEVTCESSAFIMKDLGYTCFALHDNEANFYSRKKVYKNLGFDYFISGEYMQNQNDVNENGWMRDDNLIDPILECLNSTEDQDYIFTVSVQPHGSYPTEQTIEDPVITVSGDMTDEKKYAWEYYVNQLYEEDQFIMNLINAVKQRKERTIIVFYGDHQPTMNLSDEELNSGTTFDTCYLIWDNMYMKQEDEDLYSYQLFAKVLDKLDIHEGDIFTLQQANFDESNIDFMSDLQMLQYDILYGDQYVYENKEYVVNENYKLGLYDPTIESIAAMSENLYVINGQNFTQSSKVYIDKTEYETVFVNENELLVVNASVNEHSKIRIGTQSNSSTHRILSYGPYYYMDPLDDPANYMADEIVEEPIEESDLIDEGWLEEIEDNFGVEPNVN